MSKFPDYKTVSTDSLIPYARNSRTHSDEQVAQIAASIKEFGFLAPIVIDKDLPIRSILKIQTNDQTKKSSPRQCLLGKGKT